MLPRKITPFNSNKYYFVNREGGVKLKEEGVRDMIDYYNELT